ncbi:MAG: HD domain-containing protein [Patescibacteria group bacterium]
MVQGSHRPKSSASEGDKSSPPALDATHSSPDILSSEVEGFFGAYKKRNRSRDNFPHSRELEIAASFMEELVAAVSSDPRLDQSQVDFSRFGDPQFREDFYKRFSGFATKRIAPLIDSIFTFLQPFAPSFSKKCPVNTIKSALYAAAYIAFFIHDGQNRKGEFEYRKEKNPKPADERGPGEPVFTFKKSGPLAYIEHCITAAAGLVNIVGASDLELIVATFLHDTIEDILKGIFKGTVPADDKSADVVREHFYRLLEEVFPKDQFPSLGKLLKGVSKDVRAWPSVRDKRARSSLDMLDAFSQDASLDTFRIFLIRLADRLPNQRSIGSLREDRQQAMTRETHYTYLALALFLEMPSVSDELQEYLFGAHIGFDTRELFRRWSEEYFKQQHRASNKDVSPDNVGFLGSFVSVFREKMSERGIEPSEYVLLPRSRGLRHHSRKPAGWKKFGEGVASGHAFVDKNVAAFSRGLRTYWSFMPASHGDERSPQIASSAHAVFMELFPNKSEKDYPDSRAVFGKQFIISEDVSDGEEHPNYGTGAYCVFKNPEDFYEKYFGKLPYATAFLNPIFKLSLFQGFSHVVGPDIFRLKSLFSRLDAISSADPKAPRIAHTRAKVKKTLASPPASGASRGEFLYSPASFDQLVRLVERQVFTIFAKGNRVNFIFQYPDGRKEEQKSFPIPDGCNFANALLYCDPFAVGEASFQSVTLERKPSPESSEVARTPNLLDQKATFRLVNGDRVVIQVGADFADETERENFLQRVFVSAEANFKRSVFPALEKKIRADSGP